MAAERAHFIVEEGIARVLIDHPPMNALDPDTKEAVGGCFAELATQAGDLRAVILSGAGDKAFAAGADIKAFLELQPDNTSPRLQRTHQIYQAIEDFPCPVIAAIEGYCLGGGLELALCCDLRVASREARFGFPEVKLAVFPGNGGTARALYYLPLGRVKELMYTGRMITADEALSYGLIEKLSEPGQALAGAQELAASIAKRGPLAVAAAKRVINRNRDLALAARLEAETAAWAANTAHADMKEGARAFLEKRKPVYRGK